MTTYQHMIEVSQSDSLTNSQKLHELFRDAKSAPVAKWLYEDSVLDVPADAQVLAFDGDGDALIVRFSDDTYHAIMSGEDIVPFDLFNEDEMSEFWDSYLSTDDTPLAFYRGAFIDQDLERAFLASFPEDAN